MNPRDQQWARLARAAARTRPGADTPPPGFATAVVARWQESRRTAEGLWSGADRWASRAFAAALGITLTASVWAYPSLTGGSEEPELANDAVAQILEVS